VLLINYDFPPGLSGVRRIVKLAKYLPEFGLLPVVLAATPDERMPLDVQTLAEVEEQGYAVVRTPSADPYHLWAKVRKFPNVLTRVRSVFDAAATDTLQQAGPRSERRAPGIFKRSLSRASNRLNQAFAVPDDRVGWLPFAIPAADRLMRQQAIRYVVTSSFPHSSHLVGLYLKQRYRIKWIADFRDGWTQNPYFAKYGTAAHRAYSARLERLVVRSADAVTTVSEPIAEHLRGLADNHGKVHVIPNGFDADDFDAVEPIQFDRFTMAYTGTLFMQRSPENFFAAVRGLLDCYPGLNEEFQVVFRTRFKPEHEEAIDAMGLRHVIHNWGMGTYREAVQLQMSADALLVLEGEAPNSEIMLTQKIFEYLAARKPVLAVAPKGALATLVRRTRAGVVVPPENVFRIKETLFELFLGRMNFDRDEELIGTFERRAQAARFAQILQRP
jgi:glycosyltransferase involved in cell wall biosynthesis